VQYFTLHGIADTTVYDLTTYAVCLLQRVVSEVNVSEACNVHMKAAFNQCNQKHTFSHRKSGFSINSETVVFMYIDRTLNYNNADTASMQIHAIYSTVYVRDIYM